MKLIFIHGSGGTGADFHYQTRYFQDSEAVTLPGHPDGKACKTLQGYVEWLRGYIHGKEYKDVVLAGHSMGGGIVLLYGFLYPEELKGLISIGSGARLRVHPKYLAEHHDGITNREAWDKLHRQQTYASDPAVHEKLLEQTLKVGPAVTYSDFMACDHFDLLDRVGEIKLPTLALCGTKDEMTPPLYSRYLGEHMPNAQTVIIDGASHSVMLERPQETNSAIEEFLKGLS
ncbi:MAG: alpha/beta fold hydrolase [Dehalococcoidia bacterium]